MNYASRLKSRLPLTRVVLVAALAALVIGGCGDDDDSATPGATTTTVATSTTLPATVGRSACSCATSARCMPRSLPDVSRTRLRTSSSPIAPSGWTTPASASAHG